MTKTLVLLIGLALTGVAQAQIKCWTGADGKRACGDTPPPGAKVRTIGKAAAAPDAPPAAASRDGGVRESRKRPLTTAEREREFRRRQAEEKKISAKAEQKKNDAALRRKICDRYREALRTLESGQRIQRTDWKGERYVLEGARREQEAAKARQSVQQHCS